MALASYIGNIFIGYFNSWSIALKQMLCFESIIIISDCFELKYSIMTDVVFWESCYYFRLFCMVQPNLYCFTRWDMYNWTSTMSHYSQSIYNYLIMTGNCITHFATQWLIWFEYFKQLVMITFLIYNSNLNLLLSIWVFIKVIVQQDK